LITSDLYDSTWGQSLKLEGMSVALVEPEFPLNLGYVARVMANFGLENLCVVGNRNNPNFDISLSMKFASHGDRIVERIRWVNSLDSLRSKFRVLIGTTAIRGKRKSNITRKTMDAESCAAMLSRAYNKQRRSTGICLVFGRDTTGLTNDEIKKCDYVISLTTGTDYNTLNISHAAAIIFYAFLNEFKKSKGQAAASNNESTRSQKERVVSLFEELAILSDFQKHKGSRLRETLERLLNRSNPSLREVYLLMGIASKANSQIRRLSSVPIRER